MRAAQVFLLGFVSFVGLFAIGHLASIEAQGPGAVVESTTTLGEPSAKSLKEFRQALLKSAESSVRSGELSRMDLMRLRLATLSPKVLSTLHQAAAEQVLSDGLAASYGAIDWNALLAFIKELIPLILELIKLFSDNSQPYTQFMCDSGYHALPVAIGYHWSSDLTLAA